MNIAPVGINYLQSFSFRGIESKNTNSCYHSYDYKLLNDGSLIIQDRENVPPEMSHLPQDCDICIKPDGTIYTTNIPYIQLPNEKEVTISKTSPETQELISTLKSGNSRICDKEALIENIVKSIKNDEQNYRIKMIKNGPCNTVIELTNQFSNRNGSTVEAHKLKLDNSFENAPALSYYTFESSTINSNAGTHKSYSLETQKLPQNVQDDLVTFIKAFDQNKLSFEDVERFMQQDVMPVKKQLEFV